LSTAKEKYIAFIRDNDVPLFFRDYYLDAVTDESWDVTLYEEHNKITAAYIYTLTQKWSIKYIVQPQLCPYTGPIFFKPLNVEEAYSYLIDHLPKHHLIIQDYFHDIPKMLSDPHIQMTRHTNIIKKSVSAESLWQELSSTHRRIIRKAGKELRHEVVEEIEEFLDFVSSVFRKLDKTLKQKGQRKIVKCTDKNDRVVAMCYFMNDEEWTYNFANSVIEDYRHYGMNLILWKEIEATLAEGRSFDFEGSMIPGVDGLFSRFKGSKTPYPSIYKSSNWVIDQLVKIKTSR